MNKQGEVGVGMIVVVAIALIVGAIFFQSIVQEISKSTVESTIIGLSLGTQTNGTSYYLNNYRSLSNVVISGNGTANPVGLGAGNYTVTNNFINPTTGGLSVRIAPTSEFSGTTWSLNATAQPVTYIAESGGRAVAGLISIFFALAVAVIALTPTLRSELLSMINR